MRIPHGIVRFVAGRLEARQLALHADVARAQEKLLGRILDRYRSTDIGRAMGIADVRSVEAFRREVPVRTGEDYRVHWSRVLDENPAGFLHPKPLRYVAVSSGTTGVQKPVPVPDDSLAAYRRFTNHLFFHAFRELGRYDVFDGHVLVAAGPAVKEVAKSGVLVGFGSGIASVESPRFARAIVKPSFEIQAIRDRNEKLAAIAKEAATLDVRACSGMPNAALAMFEHLIADAKRRGLDASTMRELHPNLALYGYSGMPIDGYRDRIRALLGDGVPMLEVYSSTESPVAYQYRLGEPGLLVDLSVVVLELVPTDSPDAPRIGLADAEPGREYHAVITSFGGMFAYALGDRIRVLSKTPTLIAFSRRSADELNFAGEKLPLATFREAVSATLAESGRSLGPFVVMPADRSPGEPIRYELVLELEDPPDDLARRIDARLVAAQFNYRSLRADDGSLGSIVVTCVPRGTLERSLHAEKTFGHAKLPPVVADRSVAPGIRAAAAALREGNLS